MRTASYIVTSFKRPHIVGYTLDTLIQSGKPDGWELEIVICIPYGDPGLPVVEAARVRAAAAGVELRIVHDKLTDVGSQFHRAMVNATGEVIAMCGDDDFQSPLKLYEGIKAHEAGAKMWGFDAFCFAEASTGKLSLWKGPAWRAGGTMGFDGDMLRSTGGWDACRVGNDNQIQRKIEALGYDMTRDTVKLPLEVGKGCCYLEHGANLSAKRPFPEPDVSLHHGSFDIVGIGHWWDYDHWTPAVQAALEGTCKVERP